MPGTVSLSDIDQDAALGYCSSVCLCATMLPAITRDGHSETVSKPQLNAFLDENCLGHGVSPQHQDSD